MSRGRRVGGEVNPPFPLITSSLVWWDLQSRATNDCPENAFEGARSACGSARWRLIQNYFLFVRRKQFLTIGAKCARVFLDTKRMTPQKRSFANTKRVVWELAFPDSLGIMHIPPQAQPPE